MSRIRAKNTGIEKTVFVFLRKHRIYFQQHYDRIPGKPDIALPSKKIAVFINGDFWHGYKFAAWKNRLPQDYWVKKIETNIKRDQKNYRFLKRNGWKILKVWGHDVAKRPEKTCNKILDFLCSKNPPKRRVL